jgi:hypothetical protein
MISPADVRRYSANPMAFFGDVYLRPGVPFRSCWTPEQVEFLEAVGPCLLALARRQRPPMRGCWTEAVKGWGKDSLGALCILWLLGFAQWAVVGQVAADDQGQADEVRRAVLDWIRANTWLADRIDVQRWCIVNESTGGKVDILTSDAFSSHGSRPDLILLNEVSHVQSEEFALTVLDNFSKMPDAFCLLCTNAGTLGSWAWRWRELYHSDPRWKFLKVTQTPSWQAPADIEEARRRNPPARFRRLYQGEWVSPGGDLLLPEQIERAIKWDAPLLRRDGDQHTIGAIGVDVGLSTHHSAVVAIEGSHRDHYLRVARVVDIRPPTRLEFVRDTITRVAKQYGITAIFMDAWQAMRTAEELTSMGFTVVAEQQTGSVLVKQANSLLQSFQDELLQLYRGHDGDRLIGDLYAARVVEKTYGHRIEFAEDEYGHGDRLSALLQALPACLESLGNVGAAPVVPDGPTNRRGIPRVWCDEIGNQVYWP